MSRIHPSAIVDRERCQLGEGVEIGPGCVLEGPIELGDQARLIANVHIRGPASIGAGTVIYPYACLGFPGQDFKFKLEDPTAGIRIGAGCLLRENTTIHAATKAEGPTTIGDRVFMMVGSHVGHDCRVGSDVIMVNTVHLGGHVEVGERVNLGGATMVHQFVRIGRMAFVSGGSRLSCEIPPFCVGLERNLTSGVNLVGMRRSGMPREQITAVREAYRRAFWPRLTRPEVVGILKELGADCPPVMEMALFVEQARRPVALGRRAVRVALQERGEDDGI